MDQPQQAPQADKASVRQIKIKTGSLKRNMKDYTSYKNEESQLMAKVQKMIDEGKDEHDVKQMQEAVKETSETVITCKPRIEAALDDLENTLATFDEQPDGDAKTLLKECPDWQ